MKINHLRTSREFRYVLSTGKRYKASAIEAYVCQEETKGPLVGTIITKKLAPKATQRNYIKRITYGFFNSNNINMAKDFFCVIKLVKSVKDIKKREIAQTIRQDLIKVTKQAEIKK